MARKKFRTVTKHQIDVFNQDLSIEVLSPPNRQTKATVDYLISNAVSGIELAYIKFQEGDPAKVGINGISNEALIAIVLDRLKSFQDGPHNNKFNTEAMSLLEAALDVLEDRVVSETFINNE
jgi:hypothetical protein